jgi:hypothetical protein
MKRFWFGAALLVFLLIASLYLGDTMKELTQPAESDLDKAAVAALEENWPLASALYLRAQKHWDSCRSLTAVLAHHDPIQQIDVGFAAPPSYAAVEDTTAFCSSCSQLAQQLRSLPQPHSVKWWNFL